MKVTQVSVCPTEAAQAAGRPALTPELLAASGARYSRSNEGLDAILAKIDPTNLDRSVESIFRMIDYGHQSIADMVPVAMFIDGISIWLAYHLWSIAPTAGGQESSTRYIRLAVEGLVPPETLGLPEENAGLWREFMETAFDHYLQSLTMWEEIAIAVPGASRIPQSVLSDETEAGRRKLARMQRNYAFDRARYFLPVAARTNVMLIMSARAWVQLCQNLLAHPLPEANELGRAIRNELELVAPRMCRHAALKASMAAGLLAEFQRLQHLAACSRSQYLENDTADCTHPPSATLTITPSPNAQPDFPGDLSFHENRYAWIGPDLRRTAVRFAWEAVALAEIRDLNRHRTGNKHCPLLPQGFYCAKDEIPTSDLLSQGWLERLAALSDFGRDISRLAHDKLADGDPTYVYWTLLGTQYPFEHLTTADKFIYEAELRTGIGAHFRYADHLRETLRLWYDAYPETRGLILEGSAEPE